MDIKKRLTELAEPKYKAFSKKLLPEKTVMYGVRLPLLKKIAKQELKEQGLVFLEKADYKIFEEKLICGFMIAFSKVPLSEKFELIKSFVPKIDNWSVCDSFCAAMRFKDNEMRQVFDFLQPYLNSTDEYYARFGIVMLLDHFITEDYIDAVLKAVKELKAEGYYALMAASWAVSVCMVHFPAKTVELLEEKSLTEFVQNKAIQKCRESYRVDEKTKKSINKLKIGG